MAQALTASMAADLDLPDGYQVVWAALDPASGANIAGVKVTGVSIFGTMLGSGSGGGGGGFPLGPYLLVPGPSA